MRIHDHLRDPDLALPVAIETNAHGNFVMRAHRHGERYDYDFELCKSADGWLQFDTSQDASYFGVWTNPQQRRTFTYCEGDLALVVCPTAESYRLEIEDMCRVYDTAPAFITMDMDCTFTRHYEDRTRHFGEASCST